MIPFFLRARLVKNIISKEYEEAVFKLSLNFSCWCNQFIEKNVVGKYIFIVYV